MQKDNIITLISELNTQGYTKTQIKKHLVDNNILKRTRANELVNQAFVTSEGIVPKPSIIPSTQPSQAVVTPNYSYHPTGDLYVVICKKAANGYVLLSGDMVRSIRWEYSSSDVTCDVLASKYELVADELKEVISRLGITHHGSEFTEEDLKNKTDEDLQREALARRKLVLQRKVEAAVGKDVENNAKEYLKIKCGVIDPLAKAIENIHITPYTPISYLKRSLSKTSSERAFVVGAFDWHFGGMAESRYLWQGKDWNIKTMNKEWKKYEGFVNKDGSPDDHFWAMEIPAKDMQ